LEENIVKQIRKSDDKRRHHDEKRGHSQRSEHPERRGLHVGGERAPSNYSRGENQKPVTGSYKDNWNRIFGKKKTKRCR
jgi:hypothetical protein